MNPTFETVRRSLKKFNAEENEAPPKLIIAGKKDFLDIDHKKKINTQFIIAVKECAESEKSIVEKLLRDLEDQTGQKPLAFFYNDKEAIETVINDFKDYYNTPLNKELFQKIGDPIGKYEPLFCLIIVVVESFYYAF